VQNRFDLTQDDGEAVHIYIQGSAEHAPLSLDDSDVDSADGDFKVSPFVAPVELKAPVLSESVSHCSTCTCSSKASEAPVLTFEPRTALQLPSPKGKSVVTVEETDIEHVEDVLAQTKLEAPVETGTVPAVVVTAN